jgi:hypothetical protein
MEIAMSLKARGRRIPWNNSNLRTKSAFRRRLAVEPLEDRRLLSITVNTLVDEADGSIVDGDASLRDAIALAAPGETINFHPALTSGGPASIVLELGELAVANDVQILGPGAGLLTIDASGNDPTPTSTLDDDIQNDGDGSRVFNIDDGVDGTLLNVLISGLTITGGDIERGAGIFNRENLSLAECVLSGNVAYGTETDEYGAGYGGGIYHSVGNLVVSSTTISGNSAETSGGGVYSYGGAMINVAGSTISGNDAGGFMLNYVDSFSLLDSTISDNGGNGIRSTDAGSLYVLRSTISRNASNRGAGIFSRDTGDFTVIESLISGNTTSHYGGGIYHRNGYFTLLRSTVENNYAGDDFGGGVFLRTRPSFGESALVADSVIQGNIVDDGGGGIGNEGNLTIQNSVIRDNVVESGTGGGVRHEEGTLLVDRSTISGNTADRGGGISSFIELANSTTTIINSTISGNAAASYGGGVRNGYGLTAIAYSTITQNSAPQGAGVASYADSSYARTEVRSTIIAGNNGADVESINGPDNSFQSNGYNLIGSGGAAAAFAAIGDQVGVVDPMLGPLADNGGPSATHAPHPSSPAINAGDPSPPAPPMNDQRNAPFARANGRIDIGALEAQPVPPPLTGDYNRDGAVDAADYVVWRKVLGTSVDPYSGADGDGNGVVSPIDYDTWVYHFGNADDHGNVAAAATPVVLGNSNSGVIEVSRDQDWYAFNAVAGTRYTLSTTPDSLADSITRLIGPNGITEQSRRDDATGADGIIRWTASTSGTYYVVVRAFGSATTGAYDLSVAADDAPDDHGDLPAFATPTAIPATHSANIEVPQDTDVFSFSAAAGTTYLMRLERDLLHRAQLRLIDSDGVTTLASDLRSAGGELVLVWTAPASGTYFVEARGVAERTGSYDLSLSAIADPGDDAATSTPIAVPSDNHGVIDVPDDVDWFSFNATAGVRYFFDTTLGTLEGSVLRLVDADGVSELAFDSGQLGSGAFIEWMAPSSDVYYIVVEGYGSSGVGIYELSASSDEPLDNVVVGEQSFDTAAPPAIAESNGSGFASIVPATLPKVMDRPIALRPRSEFLCRELSPRDRALVALLADRFAWRQISAFNDVALFAEEIKHHPSKSAMENLETAWETLVDLNGRFLFAARESI